MNPTYVPNNTIYDTGTFVTVHGARIHYVERGDGPTIVLVHGLADDARTWNATIEALAGKYRVIAPDLIGHGRSDKPLFNYRAGTFADFLSKFLDDLRIERATLVGNSLGGWASILVALNEPQRVERLVLVDSAGYADQHLPAVLNPTTLEESRELLSLVFAGKKFTNDPALAELILAARVANGDGTTIARFLESAQRNEDANDGKLSGLTMPTLVIWGEQDKLLPLSLGERFAKEIPGAKLAIIPNSGHVPQVESPQKFNEVLLGFLEQTATLTKQ